MLDAAPNEPEWRSWLYVVLWSLVIFCTIPFARGFRDVVRDHIGLEIFLYVTVAGVVAAGVVAYTNLRRRQLPLSAYLWLFTMLFAFIGYAYYLRDIPEEAIHVLEYGVLGLLVYRALVHRVHDVSVYFIATLVVGLIGVIDEYIQWVTPSRVFDLRDVRTNVLAGGLAQIAIATGLRPTLVSGLPSRKSLGRLCYFIAAGLVVLMLGYMNTPERVAWYAKSVPYLSFLLDSKSMMVEYGFRYDDSGIGVFRSRFSPEQLKENDRQRGEEVARVLDRYIRGEGYGPFQKTYTVPRDAYAHEAGVHLFRREYYIDRARSEEEGRGERYNIALRENLILETYFPTALRSSKHLWSPETKAEVNGFAIQESVYESAVSAGLITQVSGAQVLSGFVLAIIALLFLGAYLGRESSTSAAATPPTSRN